MLGKLEEARQILAANWRLNAPPHANTTPRIAFLRHLIALLESQPDTPFPGQLKTLLTGPELPVASDVAVPWDIAYFIEFLKPKLGEHPAEFLTALVVALLFIVLIVEVVLFALVVLAAFVGLTFTAGYIIGKLLL